MSRKPAISLKRGKIGPRLLLVTNKKSHTYFEFVPKSTTLDDLERPLRTLVQNIKKCVYEAHHENLSEDRPAPGEGCQTTVGLSKKSIFSSFGRHIFGILRNKANIVIQYYLVPRRLSSDSKIHDRE